MEAVCPECHEDCLEVRLTDNKFHLVCSSCEFVVKPNADESESSDEDSEEETEECDDVGDGVFENRNSVHAPVEKVGKKTKTVAEEISSRYTGNSESASPSKKRKQDLDKGQTASPSTCVGCGGTEFSLELINETEQLVCTGCGYFLERQEFVSAAEYTTISGTNNTYQWTRAPQPRYISTAPVITKGKEAGLKKVRFVGQHLSLRSDLIEQAVAMFETLYTSQKVINTSVELKEVLAACCVLMVARDDGISVTFKMIISIHNAKRKFYTKALKFISEICSKTMKPQKLVSLPQNVLAKGNFSSQLMQKINSLVDLCQQGFVAQGKDCTNLIVIVAHVAWLSDNQAQYKKVPLKKFCTQFNLPYTTHCEVVKKQVNWLLAKLANELPWRMAPIDKRHVALYINDIIKYKQSVLSRAFKRGRTADGESPASTPDAIFPPSRKKRRVAPEVDKSQLQLPAHITSADLDGHDLLDDENIISEKEMASYLVPPSEIELRKKLLKL